MMMEQYDERELKPSTWDLIREIKAKIRECEKYRIDYESYVDNDYLYWVIDTLDCCIKNKDSKNIIRRDYH